jgi:predicted Zn-dependent protease
MVSNIGEVDRLALSSLSMEDPAEIFNGAVTALEAGDHQTARSLLARVLKLDPTDDEARLMLIDSWRATGEIARAERSCLEHLRHVPDAVPILHELAELRLARGAPEEAAEPLKHALVLKPHDPTTLFLFGSAFLDLGHPAEAERSLKACLENDPFHHEAWHNLALAREKLGERKPALSAWRSYLTVHPGAADRPEVEAKIRHLARTIKPKR